MKLTRSLLLAAVIVAMAMSTSAARASTGCPDDPERCVERGAATPHRVVAVANHVRGVTTPAPAPTVAPAPAPAHKVAPKPVAKKPVRLVPSLATPTPATPGMGMLLKMSGGNGGDVSWLPGRLVDNSGASWIL